MSSARTNGSKSRRVKVCHPHSRRPRIEGLEDLLFAPQRLQRKAKSLVRTTAFLHLRGAGLGKTIDLSQTPVKRSSLQVESLFPV